MLANGIHVLIRKYDKAKVRFLCHSHWLTEQMYHLGLKYEETTALQQQHDFKGITYSYFIQ